MKNYKKMTSTVTSKGQITIPVELRKEFKIEKNTQVSFEVKDNLLYIRPIPTMESLGGSLKRPGQKPLSVEAMREIREKGLMFSKRI